jgi:3-hydroxyisobutyrate dehydrogenase
VWVGEAGAASRLKLVANAWVFVVVEGIAECLAYAESLGLDPALFLEATSGGASDTPYLHMKAELIAKGEFPPSFTLAGAFKDVELIGAAARGVSVADDVLAGLVAAYGRAVAAGHGEEDMAAVYRAFPPG